MPRLVRVCCTKRYLLGVMDRLKAGQGLRTVPSCRPPILKHPPRQLLIVRIRKHAPCPPPVHCDAVIAKGCTIISVRDKIYESKVKVNGIVVVPKAAYVSCRYFGTVIFAGNVLKELLHRLASAMSWAIRPFECHQRIQTQGPLLAAPHPRPLRIDRDFS